MRHKTTLFLLSTLLIAGAVVGQGAGLVGSTGVEPVVTVSGWKVLALSVIRVSNLSPGAGAGPAILAISTQPDQVDLTTAGLPGAALGIQLDPNSAAVLLLTGLPVSATGEVVLPFIPPASLAGATVYLQALQADTGAPVGGVALSDAIAVTFGTSAEAVVASTGPTAASQSLQMFFADGQHTGPVLPALDGISFLPTTLTASHDTLPMSTAVPVEDASEATRPRIILPGGIVLYHYSRPGGASGFFCVRDNGRTFQWFIESPSGFDPLIAASPFEPLIAVASDGLVPGYGGAELFLIRTDGMNFPGTASPVHPVPFTGVLNGFNLQNKSLTFINGALLFTDAMSLARVSTLPPGTASPVALALSSGLTPVDVDKELAWSSDGTTAAFTAGQSPLNRDVYVVHASGAASNVTQAAGEYQDVSYRDLVDGGTLALAPDASRVTFVKTVAGSNEIMVQNILPAAFPEQLTGSMFFENTIDQDIGIWMVAPGKVTFHAGATGLDQDVYKFNLGTQTPSPVTTLNVTATSGVLTPPFNVGATLQADHMARVGANDVVYLMSSSAAGSSKTLVWIRDAIIGDTLLLTGVTSWIGALPSGQGPLLALAGAVGSTVVRLDSAGVITPVYSSAGQLVTGLVGNGTPSAATLVLTQQGASFGAAILPLAGVPLVVTGLLGDALARNAAITAAGTILTSDGAGRLFAIDTLSGIAMQIGNVIGTQIFF